MVKHSTSSKMRKDDERSIGSSSETHQEPIANVVPEQEPLLPLNFRRFIKAFIKLRRRALEKLAESDKNGK